MSAGARMRGLRRRILLVVGVVIVAAAVGIVALVIGRSEDGPRTYRYTIPEGTSIAQGFYRKLKVMPTVLEVRVGDRLVITNRDDQLHIAGPFTIRPGETIDYRFSTPGSLRAPSVFPYEQELFVRITARE